MNRRGFFKSIAALAGAASLSPTIFIPKFEPVKWKPLVAARMVPNPAYVNAPYEFSYMDFSGYWSFDLTENPRTVDVKKAPLPLRYADIDPITYKPVPIPPFIKQ